MSCSVELRQPRQQQHNQHQQGMAEDPQKLAVIMNKSQRLVLGLIVLLLVDVIWVSSSELTKVSNTKQLFESELLNFVQCVFVFSTSIRRQNLTNLSSAHTSRLPCSRCTYWACVSGHPGEISATSQQLTR